MPRGKKKSPVEAVELKLQEVNEKITKLEDTIKSLKAEKKALEAEKKKIDIEALYNAIQESDMSIEEAKALFKTEPKNEEVNNGEN